MRRLLAAILALLTVGVATRLLMGGGGSLTLPGTYPPADDSWSRSASNPILSPTAAAWDGLWVEECSVLYDGATWRMWYTGSIGGAGNEATGYATSSDGVSWTKYGGNPVLGQGGSGYAGVSVRNSVFRDGATYYMYFSNGADLMRSTSTDGTTWTTPVEVIAHDASGAAAMTNSFVWKEGTSDWRMLLEPVGGTWIDRIGYATSSDGLSWTFQNGGGPLTDLIIGTGTTGGPWLVKEGATYHLWYHAADNVVTGLPTDLYTATSTNLLDWTIGNGGSPVLTHTGSGFEIDQVADPNLIVVDGTAYLYYTGGDNTGFGSFKIGLATAPAVP